MDVCCFTELLTFLYGIYMYVTCQEHSIVFHTWSDKLWATSVSLVKYSLGRILERVKILIFEIIVVFTIISNIKILSLRLGVSAILEIFKMRLSVTFLLKLRQLPTCRNFYDELY